MAYGLLLFRKCSLLFFKTHCPSGLFNTYIDIFTTLIININIRVILCIVRYCYDGDHTTGITMCRVRYCCYADHTADLVLCRVKYCYSTDHTTDLILYRVRYCYYADHTSESYCVEWDIATTLIIIPQTSYGVEWDIAAMLIVPQTTAQ